MDAEDEAALEDFLRNFTTGRFRQGGVLREAEFLFNVVLSSRHAGKYERADFLGCGSFGVIYRFKLREDGGRRPPPKGPLPREIAVKILHQGPLLQWSNPGIKSRA